MKTKLILGAVAFVLGLAVACVGQGGDAPVQILGAFQADQTDCKPATLLQSGGGSFDLAGARQVGANAAPFVDFLTTLQLKSEFSQSSISQNGQTLADSSRNGAYLEQIVLNYRATSGSITFEQETLSIAGYIEPGGTLNALTDIVGTKAAEKLLNTVLPGASPVEVIVSIRYNGHTAGSGGRQSFTTNTVEFPIVFFDSGSTCAAGVASGPCGEISGQGGISCNSGDGGTP